MRDVIIASANRKSAEHIKSILQRDLLFVSEIYQSGAEVLSYASIRPDAVVVCGRLSDGLPAVSLAETLPPRLRRCAFGVVLGRISGLREQYGGAYHAA
ncbi:MAG: hypothetical protein ACLRXK_09270 [Acutalibacteraceae bacterium]